MEFRKITGENLDQVIELEMEEDQKGFVEDNLYSMAQCAVYDHYRPLAIYVGKEPVGFILYYFVKDKDGEGDYVYLHRIMVDKDYQGRGYGGQALDLALDHFKRDYPSIAFVELMHYEDNDAASLYESRGFKETGELRDSSPGRIEAGTKAKNRYYEVVRRHYYDS